MNRSLGAKFVFICGVAIVLLSYQNCSHSVDSFDSSVTSTSESVDPDLSSDESRIINGFSAAERNPLLRKSVVQVSYPIRALTPKIMVKYQAVEELIELSESEFEDIVRYLNALSAKFSNGSGGAFFRTKFISGGAKCSGSMLSNERVITAAHCMITPTEEALTVAQDVKSALDSMIEVIGHLKNLDVDPLSSDSQTDSVFSKIRMLEIMEQKTELTNISGYEIEIPVFHEIVGLNSYLPNVYINFDGDIMKDFDSTNFTSQINLGTKMAQAIAVYQHPRYNPVLNVHVHDIGLIFLDKNNEIALSNPNYVSRPPNDSVDLKQININRQLYIYRTNLNLQVAGFGSTGADRSNQLNKNRLGKLNFMPFPIADITSSDNNASIKTSIYRDFVGFLDPVASLVKNYPDPHHLIESFNIDRSAMYRVSPIRRSAYHGDSGGPLYSQKTQGGPMNQFGVVSWGNITSEANLKGGFGAIWLSNDDDWNGLTMLKKLIFKLKLILMI